jgi:hypothetical protein
MVKTMKTRNNSAFAGRLLRGAAIALLGAAPLALGVGCDLKGQGSQVSVYAVLRIPQNTLVPVLLSEDLSSSTHNTGDMWMGQLAKDVMAEGRVVWTTGTVVTGTVSDSHRGTLSIRLEEVGKTAVNGDTYTAHGSRTAVQSAAQPAADNKAAKGAAIGAVSGAALGAVLGGKNKAGAMAIGGVGGGAIGYAVGKSKGAPAPSDTATVVGPARMAANKLVSFHLLSDAEISVEQPAANR